MSSADAFASTEEAIETLFHKLDVYGDQTVSAPELRGLASVWRQCTSTWEAPRPSGLSEK